MVKQVATSTLRENLADVLETVNTGKEEILVVTSRGDDVSAIINLDLLEDLLASSSSSFKASIREAREDIKKGRIFSHEEIFGKL
ncbi:MAG: hypothetical protein UY40_C0010G0007 [candidate division CPR1 bacterium GW2011_GWC1_49_13]|uniref:Antitoxin n=1 Tax=candidate division CPR1 bacterium GW2011_GWC1_49_13 TaxID=1618342 RepID=A0A0G1VHK2_9BACT|nr:MAG: hypothetical protein UY40_C0010G0007 [candidate division CPR1 bacterium GW2011_GWC1_49_13]